jgi:hypothetical protein
MSENEWRAEMCPDAEPIFCACPFEVDTCVGLWTCDDISMISDEMMSEYDNNADG